jgi:integrase
MSFSRKSMSQQSKNILKRYIKTESRHIEKNTHQIIGTKRTGKIHSIATFNKYVSCLKLAGIWAEKEYNITQIKQINSKIALKYLQHRAKNNIGQKQLNADRSALIFIVGELPMVKQLPEPTVNSKQRLHSSSKVTRYYTQEQVYKIIQHLEPLMALSTKIAYHAGLRAHELLTVSTLKEDTIDQHRSWHPDRFHSADGIRYIVIGKGGLKREVLIPKNLSIELEKYKLINQKTIMDRGIKYRQSYSIHGGLLWSKKFSTVSKKILGYSSGAHGLRHSYAQNRLQTLIADGFKKEIAKKIISQEMGHWREDIINTYLR